jgi:carbonic anhydrase/acetyltransferase-like protein (isoleucine patch superfamily)
MNIQLWRDLQEMFQILRQEKRERWDRCMPFEELLFEREEKARYLGWGDGATCYQQSYVFGDVTVGAGTWVGPFTLLDGAHAPLRIGEYCTIAPGVQIYTHDSVRWALSGGRARYDAAPTTIGDHCYVGAHSVVLKGVTVGEGCLIGAHSVVRTNLPPHSVAVGVPAQIVRETTAAERCEATAMVP